MRRRIADAVTEAISEEKEAADIASKAKKILKDPKLRKAIKAELRKDAEAKDDKGRFGYLNGERYTKTGNLSDGSKRKIVTQKLDNEAIDHAPLAEELFSDMSPDAARSYFSKKFNGKGGLSFSDKEIEWLYDKLNKV